MKIKIIALSLISLCASQAFANQITVINNTGTGYNVRIMAGGSGYYPYVAANGHSVSGIGGRCLSSISFTDGNGNSWTQNKSGSGCGSWTITIIQPGYATVQ